MVHLVASAVIMLLLGISSFCDGKKGVVGTVPCPVDGTVGCIECNCDATGFNMCTPLSKCPKIATSMSDVKSRTNDACPYGAKFEAECTLCECTGDADHCALCFALPVRRPNQPEEVNKKLPWLQDNRFFNYEVNGWMPAVE